MPSSPANHRWAGAVNAILAYGAWGLFPIYWKFFGLVSPLEIISHRVVWSLVFLSGLIFFLKLGPELQEVLRKPGRLAALFGTAALLTMNWAIFIYGVSSSQVVQTSLGYFINPLVSVLLGFLILKERLNRAQVVACLLAAAGVVWYGWQLGHLPWIAIALALTFGFYGMCRKVVPVSPIVGVALETALMSPLALGVIFVLAAHHGSHFRESPTLTLLFLGAGIVTSIPLIWFNNAAKLLPLSTLGFLQYLAPTLQLLVGVALYHEPFTYRHAIAFSLIWIAVGIYLRFGFRRRSVSETPE